MTEFNQYEKRIIIAIMIAIMEADGVIDHHETEYLDRVISDFNMSDTELDTLDELDFNQAVADYKLFDSSKKEKAGAMFMAMARCDGYADPRELNIIKSLGR